MYINMNMKAGQLDNSCPTVFKRQDQRQILPNELDDAAVDKVDSREVFDHISCICDPEHPNLTLEELHVVDEELITVDDDANRIHISYTPTMPSCGMALVIGLCLRVKLMRCLPPRFKVTVEITPGSHNSEMPINKQLADKERIAAALEKPSLLAVVNQCLAGIKN